MPSTRSNPTSTTRPAAPGRPDTPAEHAAIAARVAELAEQVTGIDAVDRLELGDLDGAERLSQAAREDALVRNDLAGLALATATLAAVRTVQHRTVEAQAMWVDAENFLVRAPHDPRVALTRRLLDVLAAAD